jgi:ubiquinone/menaquinone biosynthesis C-methylase UbiE
VIYQHPLAYLIGLEGVALLRAWGGDFDEAFVRARLDEVRHLLADDELNKHPGAYVEQGATSDAYRQWAETYDQPGNELLELDLPIIDAILDVLPTGTAVDTACGTGRLARRLAERGHRVVGVDGSVDMLREARRNLPGVSFVVGDLDDLPLPDASVDLVTNALALTHVVDLDHVLAEFARVLRPGGVAIISDVHPDLVTLGSAVKGHGPAGQHLLAACHRRTVADYLRAAMSAGFRVRGFEEQHRASDVADDSAPDPEPAPEIGDWRDWPWTLLDWVPEASRAAWDIPAVLVWHLQFD